MSYDIPDIEGLPAKERSWKFEIKADPDTDYEIIVHRERVALAPTGKAIYRLYALPTGRKLSQIATKTYTYDGITLTGEQLAGFLSLFGDVSKQEDESNA